MRTAPVLAACMMFGGVFAGNVKAASLEISPVVITLAPGQTAATIEVLNRGDTPSAVQARPFGWSQSGDEDPLTPSQAIILSPPIFTIPPGASQTVRLLLRGGPGAGGERSFRLLLDEVPPASANRRAVVIALRVSVPVFATSADATPAKLQWKAERGPDGQVIVTAHNAGHSYDRVSAMVVTLADGSHPKAVLHGSNPYVLPGAERRWTVQAAVSPLHLNVTDLSGASDQTLVP